MAPERELRFHLNISADEYSRYYRGTARFVHARSVDGRTVRFPINVLQPHLTHEGVHGEFILYFDHNNKFIRLDKIA